MVGWKMRSAGIWCRFYGKWGVSRKQAHLVLDVQCLNKLAESNLPQHSQQFWHRTTAEHVDIVLIVIKHFCVTARESMLPRWVLDFCCLYRSISIGNFSAEKWVAAAFEGVYPASAAAAACLVYKERNFPMRILAGGCRLRGRCPTTPASRGKSASQLYV